METELFIRWYVNPIEKLKELPDGDGGFVAFMVALPLYDRYIVAKLKLDNKSTNPESVNAEMAKDLHLSTGEQKVFWGMFRNGFMHQAMPKDGNTKWITSSKFTEFPEFVTINKTPYVQIDPWKFVDRVLNLFMEDQRLISASESFPLASIFSIPK